MTNTESEDESPSRPLARSKGSSFIVPLNDASTITDLNDDAAERRQRRKSAKQSVSFHDDSGEHEASSPHRPSTPERTNSGPSAAALQRTPKMSALARANQLSSVNQTPVPAVSLDVMSSNFEEWMKMATDNKINANNAWNFALIDYFQDMSLLRNERDNSINFQKASFTLDGCVKIWTSRVDSVGTETGKLLSNLADEVGAVHAREGEDDQGEDGEAQKAKKAKTHRPEATLAKSITQLQVKKLDLEFTVDPLFKKTSADFDEGGAMGLLMNHLSVDEKIRVVFDAGDSKLENYDDEASPPVASTLVDISEIRSKFIPSIDIVISKSISDSLADFHFSSDNQKDLPPFSHFTERDDEASSSPGDDIGFGELDDFLPQDHPEANAEDFFIGDQAVLADNDGPEQTAGLDHSGIEESRDPKRLPDERDLVMALAEGGEEMLDYFDSAIMKNWAGPEHWKLRKVARKPEINPDTAAGTRKKKEKQSFSIDFETQSTKSAKELFTPAARSNIALPSGTGVNTFSAARRKSKKASGKPNDHLLPDDMHFSSVQLLRLFLKPKFTLRMRKHGFGYNHERGHILLPNGSGNGEIDENFWAQAAAGQAGDEAMDGNESGAGGGVPFNTQFFHDDYDDAPGFDEDFVDAELAEGQDEDDLITASQGQLKRTRPEFVSYAKKAKRVDVRKLKDNIWNNLDIVIDRQDEGAELVEADARPPSDPTVPRYFTSVIEGLQTTYPKEKMEEISTSFCFICLLHLANEQGLKIEVEEGGLSTLAEGEDDASAQKRVGDIWGLKVYRDPDATQSA